MAEMDVARAIPATERTGAEPVSLEARRAEIQARKSDAAAPDTQGAPARSGARKRRRRIAAGVAALALIAAGVGYGHSYLTTGRYLESTDDAYLQSDAVTVAPKVAGYIAELNVTDNQPVKAGQVIARIDDRDFRAAVDQAQADVHAAEADIRNIDAQIRQQQASIDQAQADVASAEAAVRFSEQDFQRYVALERTGYGTVQRSQQAQSDIRQKQAQVAHSRAVLTAAQQQVEVLQTARDKAVAALARDQAVAEQAALNLSYTAITAPVDGVIGDRALRLGQYVQPGTALMQVVPLQSGIYLVANFKETQLARMTRGQQVDVEVDSFPGHVFKGTVDSLAPGSGSQFALLPPENATGNFTKIVQRVPVKILIDSGDPLIARLRPGLSVETTVDTKIVPADATTLAVGPAAQHAALGSRQ